MFEKGYGVCVDQSIFIHLFLKEKGIVDTNLNLWIREYFIGHLNVVFKNIDGRFYILDNFGLSNEFYNSQDEALAGERFLAKYYRESISIRNVCNTSNLNWFPLMTKADISSVCTTDKQWGIRFSQFIATGN